MIQFILTIVEDIIMVCFLSFYIEIEEKLKFILLVGAVCIVETTIAEEEMLTMLLPIIISISLMISIFLIKKKLSLNVVIASVLSPVIIIVTDLIALVIVSGCLSVDFVFVANSSNYLFLASIIAKFLLIIFYVLILYINKNIGNMLSYRQWWILLPIWSVIFLLLYFLGFSILHNTINANLIYLITFFLIVLSVMLLILFYKIQKESEMKRRMELETQKNYYVKKNKEMLSRLYDEISKIEHSSIYNFLHIKGLLANKDYNEIEIFVDNNINKIKKLKNVIITENPYFSYVINKKVNELLLKNSNIKVSIIIENKDFQVEEFQLKFLIKVIDILFNNSDKDKSFNISFFQTNMFLKMTVIFEANKNNFFDEKNVLNYLEKHKNMNYKCKKIDSYYMYIIVLELSG